jgi:hypothetical protein
MMIGGGDLRTVVEREVDHRVFAAVPDERADGSGFGASGFGVGGKNLVTDLDVGHRSFLAVGHPDEGVGGEAVQTGLRRVV